MRRRMVGLVALAGLVSVVGCGGDSDDKATSSCTRIMSTICNKYVECRVTVSGTVFTSALCQQALSTAVQQCVTENGAAIRAATDTTIDTCVQDLGATACTAICDQIPADPPSCQTIDPEPNTDMITCQP